MAVAFLLLVSGLLLSLLGMVSPSPAALKTTNFLGKCAKYLSNYLKRITSTSVLKKFPRGGIHSEEIIIMKW
jgi:hypothetical protein